MTTKRSSKNPTQALPTTDVTRRTFLRAASIGALSAVAAPHLLACSASDDGAAAPPGEAFRFVVFSDTHVRLPGNPDDGSYDNQGNIDNLAGAVEQVNTLYPDAAFVAVTGDMVGCLYSDDPADYLIGQENPAEKFKSLMSGLTVPWHVAIGNHDYQKGYDTVLDEAIMTDDIAKPEAVWKKVLGIDPYYSVLVHGWRMIFLNSNRGTARSAVCEGNDHEAFCTGSFDDEQLAWFEQELAEPEPCIVFVHHPIHTDIPGKLWSLLPSFLVDEGDKVYAILDAHQDKIKAIFTGHGHLWVKDVRGGIIPVFETSAIGDHNGNPLNYHVVNVGGDGTLDVVKANEAGRYQ